jgi:hypothetical protein
MTRGRMYLVREAMRYLSIGQGGTRLGEVFFLSHVEVLE